jgi:hypothetical protein
MWAGRVGGRRGAGQLLLRSQGPRGPIAIACPILTHNQSLHLERLDYFTLLVVVVVWPP